MHPCHLAKVVLCGQSGVGKSSIVYRFNHDDTLNTSPTVGAAFTRKKITEKGDDILMDVWDTAGQERYLAMAPFYFRHCHYCLLVFDLSDYYTFEDVDKWRIACENSTHNIPPVYILIGNKLDRDRKIVAKTVQDYCKVNNIKHYIETSAETGEGIPELQAILSDDMFSRINSLPKQTGLGVEELAPSYCSC